MIFEQLNYAFSIVRLASLHDNVSAVLKTWNIGNWPTKMVWFSCSNTMYSLIVSIAHSVRQSHLLRKNFFQLHEVWKLLRDVHKEERNAS
jgi:heme exporter protein D